MWVTPRKTENVPSTFSSSRTTLSQPPVAKTGINTVRTFTQSFERISYFVGVCYQPKNFVFIFSVSLNVADGVRIISVTDSWRLEIICLGQIGQSGRNPLSYWFSVTLTTYICTWDSWNKRMLRKALTFRIEKYVMSRFLHCRIAGFLLATPRSRTSDSMLCVTFFAVTHVENKYGWNPPKWGSQDSTIWSRESRYEIGLSYAEMWISLLSLGKLGKTRELLTRSRTCS